MEVSINLKGRPVCVKHCVVLHKVGTPNTWYCGHCRGEGKYWVYSKPVANISYWVDQGNYLMGHITNHPRQEHFKQHTQGTGYILDYFTDTNGNKCVETHNTVFILGEEMDLEVQAEGYKFVPHE